MVLRESDVIGPDVEMPSLLAAISIDACITREILEGVTEA
jgi:hypothetical protein